MKLNKNAGVLLERYLLAVKRELGGKTRVDIAAEIESYIYDLLDERYPKADEVTEKELEVILKEMGAPRKVAAQYSGQRYLIGPRLFSIYILVVKIMLCVVLGALTLSMIIASIVEPAGNVWQSILEYLGSLWSGALSVVGVITLIFAIIERSTECRSIDEIEELQELKISDLPELPENEKEVSRVGVSIEILLGVIGMVFFTYVQKTGGLLPYWINTNSSQQMIRLFTENFVHFIPFSLALTGLEIARNTTLLVQGYHSSLTNWWDVSLKVAGSVLLVFLISSLPLISLDFFQELEGASVLSQYESQANTGLAIVMGLGIFGNIVEIIQRIVREVRNPSL